MHALSSDDKKRLIVESQGSLDYKEVVANLKLLGSRFFHEVHAGKAQNIRTKPYDTTTFFADEEPAMVMTGPTANVGDDEPTFFGDPMEDGQLEQWAEDGDPDAIVCMQFEEGLVDTLHSDPDMAACMNVYVEARKRLTDKAKGCGFWNPSRKGFGKGRRGKGDRLEFRPRKPLAQRILESNCRRCGAKGHWKAECPLRQQGSSATTGASKDGAFAGLALQESDVLHEADVILIDPATRNDWQVVFMSLGHAHTTHVSSPHKGYHQVMRECLIG